MTTVDIIKKQIETETDEVCIMLLSLALADELEKSSKK